MSETDNLRKSLEAQVRVGEKAAAMIRELNEERHALTEEKERLQGYVSDWRHECAQKDVSIKRLTADNQKLRAALVYLNTALDRFWNAGPDKRMLDIYVKPIVSAQQQCKAALSNQPEGQDND